MTIAADLVLLKPPMRTVRNIVSSVHGVTCLYMTCLLSLGHRDVTMEYANPFKAAGWSQDAFLHGVECAACRQLSWRYLQVTAYMRHAPAPPAEKPGMEEIWAYWLI
jgi:hypothetical protein